MDYGLSKIIQILISHEQIKAFVSCDIFYVFCIDLLPYLFHSLFDMIFYGTFIYLQTVHVGILSLLFLSHFAEKLISNQSQSIFQAAVNSDLPRNATGKHFIHKFSGSVHTLF